MNVVCVKTDLGGHFVEKKSGPDRSKETAAAARQRRKVKNMARAVSALAGIDVPESMQKGEAKDSVRLKAAETLGKHYGLFTDRLAIEKPERSPEEVREMLETRLRSCLN